MNKDFLKNIGKTTLISLIPHVGCILFSILLLTGATFGTAFLTKFLSNKLVFPISIFLSFVLVAIYSYFYFKRNCCKNKIQHISIMFFSMLSINALLFFFVFPWLTNIKVNNKLADNLSELRLEVDIPCSGHSSIIAYELRKAGISDVTFDDPDIFDLKYDSSKITKEQITNLELFKDFKIKNIL